MDKENIILTFLSNDSFIQLNERVLQILKGDAYSAIILCKLFSSYRYYKESASLVDGGWFYQTISDFAKKLCMSEHRQRRAIKYLESIKFISVKKIGLPPRRFFRINFDHITDVLMENEPIKIFSIPSDNKKEFYKNLNESIYKSIPTYYAALDNLKKDVGEVMFAWSRLYKHYMFREWKWNSQEFGKLNNYWKEIYRNKRPFDFSVMLKYFQTYPDANNVSIYNFINFDRAQLNEPVQIKSLVEIMEDYSFLKDKKEN